MKSLSYINVLYFCMFDPSLVKINLNLYLNPLTWWNRLKFNKANIRLLFVDDENMPVVENLKKLGWSVEKVKDVRNLDEDVVQRSHVIFVDFKGVGRNLSSRDQGAALISALKEKYGNKKRVILYSADYTIPSNLALTGKIDCADAKIRKNANPIEFLNIITEQMKKLR